ncbi:hypothetical protein [Bacillus inaquosorum]|uniref:hypothetical protein n=1 Tax=Bacillus inaquosorum TaxID=483913 RepID=UPI002DBCD9A6|nr:hypothetical protein [Bacillus inaquosorum]MEC2062670.1 hypothetical protein [Bacillus inaquosorum]MEC2086187.1 hypothetical protein [Bacillus inaquosorum]
MRKPKTARLKKKKGLKRDISLQEAFDVIAEELCRRGQEHCAFIALERWTGKVTYSERKIELSLVGDEAGEHISVVKSSKAPSELKKGLK